MQPHLYSFLFPLQRYVQWGKFHRHFVCAQPSTTIRKYAKKFVEARCFNVAKAAQETHTKAMHKLCNYPRYALSQPGMHRTPKRQRG